MERSPGVARTRSTSGWFNTWAATRPATTWPRLTGTSASLVERVWASGEALVVTGTEEVPRWAPSRSALRAPLDLAAPLELERGRTLGVIYLDSQVREGRLTPDDVGILTALTKHTIATSLETARAAQLELRMRTAQQQRDLAVQLHDALQLMTGPSTRPRCCARLLGRHDPGWCRARVPGLLLDEDVIPGISAVLDAGALLVGDRGDEPGEAFTERLVTVPDVVYLDRPAAGGRTVRLGVITGRLEPPRPSGRRRPSRGRRRRPGDDRLRQREPVAAFQESRSWTN